MLKAENERDNFTAQQLWRLRRISLHWWATSSLGRQFNLLGFWLAILLSPLLRSVTVLVLKEKTMLSWVVQSIRRLASRHGPQCVHVQ